MLSHFPNKHFDYFDMLIIQYKISKYNIIQLMNSFCFEKNKLICYVCEK